MKFLGFLHDEALYAVESYADPKEIDKVVNGVLQDFKEKIPTAVTKELTPSELAVLCLYDEHKDTFL